MNTEEEFEKKIHILINKLRVGLYDEVIIDAKKLLKISKNQIIINILSLAYQGNQDYESSIKLLKLALKTNPKNIFFLNNIGLSYFKNNELKNAEYYYKRAIEINPNYLNVLNNYGQLKKEQDQFDEAIEFFKKALATNNDNLETNYNLAVIYQQVGDYENAIKYFEKSIKINPKFTKSDHNISLLIKYTENNKHFISMKEKISNNNLNNSQILELNFALAKAYEDIKDYKNSFENTIKANILMKNITKYKIEQDKKLFKEIINLFNEKNFTPADYNKTKVIFILGMPRSGTSLVEQIISSHHAVFGGGELSYLNLLVNEKITNNSEIFYKSNNIFNNLQKEYMSMMSNKNKNFLNFTDKSPLNFRWIGFIINMFPNSKIIHCKRNKIDVCWSNFKNKFEGALNFSNDLQDLKKYYQLYENLMQFWEKKFPNKIYNLEHEELINNSEKTIKNLINFCDLDWDKNCLKHHENKRAIKTVSFIQARKPIYKEKVKNSFLYDKYLDELK